MGIEVANLQQGDLVLDNQKLVYSIVNRKYFGRLAESEDLIQIGTIGLIKAKKSYNPSMGIKFSTYAWKCINNELNMFFRSIRKHEITQVNIDELQECIGKEDIENEQLFIEDLKKILTDKEFNVIKLVAIEGYKQEEASDIIGLSQSQVSRIRKSAEKKIKNYFTEKML